MQNQILEQFPILKTELLLIGLKVCVPINMSIQQLSIAIFLIFRLKTRWKTSGENHPKANYTSTFKSVHP